MYTVEFRAKIRDGIIQIPEKYRKQMKHRVKVILLSESTSDISSDIIEELLASPIKLPDFTPLK